MKYIALHRIYAFGKRGVTEEVSIDTKFERADGSPMPSSVDDETILEVLRTSESPALTTTAIAEQLPITRGSTRSRLQALADDDRVERDREGRNVIWWVPERREAVEAWREAESGVEAEAEAEPEPEAEATEQATAETEDGPIEVDVEAEAAAADEAAAAAVETPEAATEMRTAAERADRSRAHGGLRALALVAIAAVGYLLFRKLRR